MIADLCEVDIVVTHGPEGIWGSKDDEFVHLHARLSNGVHRADRNRPDQAAWFQLSDGLCRDEKCGSCGDPVIHENDGMVGQCGEPPILAVEVLPSSDLALLCLNQPLDIGLRKPVCCHGIMVQIDPSRLTHCAQGILGVVRCSQLPGNEHVQRKMQAQAQLVADCDPATWQRQDEGRRILMVPHQPVDQPSTGRADVHRPELRRMVADASKAAFDMVIVESCDRIARDQLTLIMVQEVVGRPIHSVADHHLSSAEEQRAKLVRRLVEGRKAAKGRLAEMGFASPFPFEGKMPKLGRRLHAQLRKMYHAACQAGGDRSEVARALNLLARSIELGRRGNA